MVTDGWMMDERTEGIGIKKSIVSILVSFLFSVFFSILFDLV